MDGWWIRDNVLIERLAVQQVLDILNDDAGLLASSVFPSALCDINRQAFDSRPGSLVCPGSRHITNSEDV